MKMSKLMLLFTCFVISVNAEDLGIIGKTYPIGEQNLLDYIKTRAATVVKDGTWKKYQQELIAKTERQINYPPVIGGITRTTESSVRYFDPSVRVNSDVVDPYTKTVLAKKGQIINPTSYVPFNNELIFIDGRDPEQVAYALTESKRSKFRTSIVLIAAVKLRELMEKEQQILFYDQGAVLVKKFSVQHVPTIIYQDQEQPNFLRVEEVKL